MHLFKNRILQFPTSRPATRCWDSICIIAAEHGSVAAERWSFSVAKMNFMFHWAGMPSCRMKQATLDASWSADKMKSRS